MAVTGIGTYASYTNSYGNTQNAGNKTGRTYKNAHEYKNYCKRSIGGTLVDLPIFLDNQLTKVIGIFAEFVEFADYVE